MIPNKLNIGDTIGLISPSDYIAEKDIEDINKAITLMEQTGFKIKIGKNVFKNTTGYGATAKEKAEDINQMFKDKQVKAIFCLTGGFNSNSVFEYLDYDIIKYNPKIICGFSDSTSILNIIYEKTGLITFHGPTLKSLVTWETDYGYREVMKRFVYGGTLLGQEDDKYTTIKDGKTEGILVGGNLSLVNEMSSGKYKIDFTDKILFLEELYIETPPALASNYLYNMKQNGVFDKIKGIWVGNYDGEIALEKILMDTLEGAYRFPIIKSNNFGHTDKKAVIPIGIKARIETDRQTKIELLENCVLL